MRILRSVVGWHGSRAANGALLWAADHEARRAGSVLVVRVLQPQGGGDEAERVSTARGALQVATEALSEQYPGTAFSARIVIGDPAEQLTRTAGKESLLVVGASHPGRVRGNEAHPIAVEVVARREGATAVIPVGAPAGRGGVVVLVHDPSGTSGAVSLAAQAARELGEPLTVVHLQDRSEVVNRLSSDHRAAAPLNRDRGGLATLDPRSIGDPVSLLSRFDGASLLVVEGHRSPSALLGFNLERWLARYARAPFIVVGPSRPRPGPIPRQADRTGDSAAAR